MSLSIIEHASIIGIRTHWTGLIWTKIDFRVINKLIQIEIWKRITLDISDIQIATFERMDNSKNSRCANIGNGIFPESDTPFDAILCIQFPILPLWTVHCEKKVFAFVECTVLWNRACGFFVVPLIVPDVMG